MCTSIISNTGHVWCTNWQTLGAYLNSSRWCQLEEICVTYIRVLCLDRLQQRNGASKAGIGTMHDLRVETDGPIGSSCLGPFALDALQWNINSSRSRASSSKRLQYFQIYVINEGRERNTRKQWNVPAKMDLCFTFTTGNHNTHMFIIDLLEFSGF